MKLSILFFLIVCSFNSFAKLPAGFGFNPYVYSSMTSYKIEPNVDAGNMTLWGAGALVGLKLPMILIGMEMRAAKPVWSPDNSYTPDRADNPIAESVYYALGAGIKITLWRLSLLASYYPLERMKFEPGDKYIGQTDYFYEGAGLSYGIGLRLYRSVSVFAQLHNTNFDHYSRTEDIELEEGDYSRADREERENPLKLNSLVLGISANFGFDDFFNISAGSKEN